MAERWTPDCGQTPYRVFCRGGCGSQHLSKEDYIRQLSRPDAMWQCPRCGETAGWDDEWYEGLLEYLEATETDEDAVDPPN